MKAAYTHDAVATIGKYKDRTTGEEKKNFLTVGKLFTDDEGRMSLKLDGLPVNPEWSGWLSFYPRRTDGARPAPTPPRQDAHNQAKANAYQPQPQADDDIPF